MARPPFKVTTILRKQVSVAAGAGMAHAEIATALGISRNTLEKHFRAELSIGSLQKRMEIVQSLYTAAKKGNVAAQKAYLAFTPTAHHPPRGVGDTSRQKPEQQALDGIPPAPEKPDDQQPLVQPKAMMLGKKDQAKQDAITAEQGTDWEGLLPTIVPTNTSLQ